MELEYEKQHIIIKMKAKKFIIFGKPSIGEREIRYTTKVLQSKWIGTGPIVQKFEKNFMKLRMKYLIDLY